jgi:hypothetical protein
MAFLNNDREAVVKSIAAWLCVLFAWQSAFACTRTSSDSLSSIEDGSDVHLSYVAGYELLGPDWAPARHHVQFGLLDCDFGRPEWPVRLAAQMLLSYSPAIPRLVGNHGDYSGVYEINVGVRKLFALTRSFQPHVAAGVGLHGASTTTWIEGFGPAQEGHNSSLGLWGNAGFYWIPSGKFFSGLSVQYSRATITLFNQRLAIGGFHLLMHFGFHW